MTNPLADWDGNGPAPLLASPAQVLDRMSKRAEEATDDAIAILAQAIADAYGPVDPRRVSTNTPSKVLLRGIKRALAVLEPHHNAFATAARDANDARNRVQA